MTADTLEQKNNQPHAQRGGARFLTQILGLLLTTNAAQYLWLYHDTPLTFYVWGFPIIVGLLLPSIGIFFLLRRDDNEFLKSEFRKLGSVRSWIVALIVPVFTFALSIFLATRVESRTIPWTKQWNALAASTLFDLPVLYVWLLPSLLSHELLARFFIRNRARTQSSFSFHSSLFSTALWILLHSTLLAYSIQHIGMIPSLLICILWIATGIFLYWQQAWGSMYSASFALLLTALLFALSFGNSLVLPNKILFGSDVTELKGLFEVSSTGSLSIIIATTIFSIFSLIVFNLFRRQSK